jgi:hypothetical protein
LPWEQPQSYTELYRSTKFGQKRSFTARYNFQGLLDGTFQALLNDVDTIPSQPLINTAHTDRLNTVRQMISSLEATFTDLKKSRKLAFFD